MTRYPTSGEGFYVRDTFYAEAMPSHAVTAAAGFHKHEREPVEITNVGIVGWLCKLCDWAYIADDWIRYGRPSAQETEATLRVPLRSNTEGS